LNAEIKASAQEPYVEMFIGARLVALTIWGPRWSREQVQVVVTRSSVRLAVPGDDQPLEFTIALPVTVQPGRHVIRFNQGLIDLLVARVERSD
jgi:hypothetical protein